MRVDAHTKRIGHVGDCLALGDPAGGTHIRLQNVDRAVDDDPAEAPAGKFRFAAGDRDAESRLPLPIAVEVFGWDRFLEPGDVELLDLPSHSDRGYGVISMVGIDHDRHCPADRPAYCAA